VDEDTALDSWVTNVPLLPAAARGFLGERAAIRLTVYDRDGQGAAALT